tara:strand:+ start:690 stop:1163 length:474 start_codon:yes stop_codon:yes gene_type:complete
MYKFLSAFWHLRGYRLKDTLIVLALVNTILLLVFNMDQDNIRILGTIFRVYSFLGILTFHCISIGPFLGLGLISLINRDLGRNLAEEMSFNFWELVSSLKGGFLYFSGGIYSLIFLCFWGIIAKKELMEEELCSQIMSSVFWVIPLLGLASILRDEP